MSRPVVAKKRLTGTGGLRYFVPRWHIRARKLVVYLLALTWLGWMFVTAVGLPETCDPTTCPWDPNADWDAEQYRWHVFPPVWLTVLALTVVGVALVLWFLAVSREATRAHSKPDAVPLGVALPNLPGYAHLRRNPQGAIDMALYTAEQWRATGLPYCKRHMDHPAASPCGCGTVVTADLLTLIGARLERRQWITATVAMADAAYHGFMKDIGATQEIRDGHAHQENGAIFWAVVITGVRQLRMRRLERAYNLLAVHPELTGVWLPYGFYRRHAADYLQPSGILARSAAWAIPPRSTTRWE